MRKFMLVLLFVGSCTLLKAQTDSTAALFRGRQAPMYLFRHNGTPYWNSPEYLPGDVMFNGTLYRDVILNVDASFQDVYVQSDKSMFPIVVPRSQVSWFTMDGRLFVNLRYQGYEEAADGYWEVLSQGKDVILKQVRKTLYVDTGDKNGSVIGYDDPNYNTDVLEYFRYEPQYLQLSNGTLTPFSSARTFRNLYPDKRRAIRKEASRRDVPGKRLDEYIVAGMSAVDAGAGAGRTDNLVVWCPDGEPRHRPIGSVTVPKTLSTDLPAGYFEEQQKESEVTVDENAILATFRNKVYHIGDKATHRSGKAVITGCVRDIQTGEPLEMVTVFDEKTRTYASTDRQGRYRLSVPTGENMLHFTEYSRDDMDLRVVIEGSGSLDIVMKEKVTMLNSAMISSESMSAHRSAQIGVERVSMKTISKIPSAFGEGDVIKAVLTLPGVKTTGEASGGFNVRGGAADQNLILFNGGTLYNPSHLFGLFSAFNPDVVESVELYKCSIPALYGGRISSVLDVTGKEGASDRFHGSLGIGLLTSRATIEGPIPSKKGTTTLLLGGRITYSDWLLRQLPKDSGYSGGSAGFGDLNFSLTRKRSSRNTIQLSAYASSDRFAFSGDTTFRYRNLSASLKWLHRASSSLTWTFSGGYDHYDNRLQDLYHPMEAYSLDTRIDQAWLKFDFQRTLGAHTLIYGLQATGYDLQGGHMMPQGKESLVIDRTLGHERAIEAALYVGDTWQLNERLSVDGGVRLSGYHALSPAATYLGPELRLSGKYSLADNLTLKAGFNTLRQYIHLISNSSSISPMDTWKLSGEGLRPTSGWQAAGGLYWTVWNSQVDLSAEVYWKQMRDYLDYRSGATLVMNPNLVDDLVRTRGKAYGVELMARKSAGKLTGWVSYTWSRSFLQEMEDRGLETINGGRWYNAPHDKPHDVKLVANLALTRRYSFSANLEYATGRPVTIPIGYYYYGGGYRLAYTDRNAYRIPDYFRLDLAINIDPGHYLKALAHASVTIGCYNVTGRKNPYSVYYTTSGGGRPTGHMISVFATQIPYINLNILF